MKLTAVAVVTFLAAMLCDVEPKSDSLRDLCYIDIVLLADFSGSILASKPYYESNFMSLRLFVASFVEKLQKQYPDVRIAMVAFWDEAPVQWMFDKSTDVEYTQGKIEKLKMGGATNMTKAFLVVRDKVLADPSNRPNVPDMVVFMTDGFPNPLRFDPSPLAAELKSKGVNILGLGITEQINDGLMRQISSPNQYIKVESYTALLPKVDSIISSACTQPPPPPPPTCNYDIGLLIDSSASITERGKGGWSNWEALQNFLKEFVQKMHNSYPEVQMAMMTFNDNTMVQWQWQDGTNVSKMKSIIERMRVPQGNTRMKMAFENMRRIVFGNHGNRKDVPDLMIFMTDGKPNPEDTQDPTQVARQMKAAGVQILGLGITNSVNDELMYDVVSPDSYLPIKNYPALMKEVQRIINMGCTKPRSG